MRKIIIASGLALSLAACGAGTVAVIQNIYDEIQAASQALCGFRPVFATIDAIIKALGGPPVVDTVAASSAPKPGHWLLSRLLRRL
jgi:hypothetical protein